MKLIRWAVTLAYAGVIFYLSSRTWPNAPSFPYADKIAHIILYTGFGGLVLWSLRKTRFRGNSYIYAVAIILSTSYGLSDEVHQLFIPGREFSIFDLMADAVGSAIGVLVVTKLATLASKEKVLI